VPIRHGSRSAGLATVAAFATEATTSKTCSRRLCATPSLAPWSQSPTVSGSSRIGLRPYCSTSSTNSRIHCSTPSKTCLIQSRAHGGAQRMAYDEAIAYLREEEANFADLPASAVQPLRDLAASSAPYRGNVLPMQGRHSHRSGPKSPKRLNAERTLGLGILDERETQLRGAPEFQSLSADSAQQVLHLTTEARKTSQPMPALSRRSATASPVMHLWIIRGNLLLPRTLPPHKRPPRQIDRRARVTTQK